MASSERLAFGLALLSTLAFAGELDALPLATRAEHTTVGTLLSRADATVFVFWSAGCPCVRRYQDRVDALTAEWGPKGVAVVQVSSNAGENLDALPTNVWRDEGGRLAKALKARSTPTVVLVRRDGEVLFSGWIDNERQPGELGREPWLEQALTAFARGERGPSKSPSWGCPITRSLGGS